MHNTSNLYMAIPEFSHILLTCIPSSKFVRKKLGLYGYFFWSLLCPEAYYQSEGVAWIFQSTYILGCFGCIMTSASGEYDKNFDFWGYMLAKWNIQKDIQYWVSLVTLDKLLQQNYAWNRKFVPQHKSVDCKKYTPERRATEKKALCHINTKEVLTALKLKN